MEQLFDFNEDSNTSPSTTTLQIFSTFQYSVKIITDCLINGFYEIKKILPSIDLNNKNLDEENIVSLLYYVGGLSIDQEKSNINKFILKIPNLIAKNEIILKLKTILSDSEISLLVNSLTSFVKNSNIDNLENLCNKISEIRFSKLIGDDLINHKESSLQETFAMCLLFSSVNFTSQKQINSTYLDLFIFNSLNNQEIMISLKNISIGYIWKFYNFLNIFKEWEQSNNWDELKKRSDKIFCMKKEDILNLPYYDVQNKTTITINNFFEQSKKEEINKYKKLYKKETKWFIILRVGLKKMIVEELKP
jgi:hypothetical protein